MRSGGFKLALPKSPQMKSLLTACLVIVTTGSLWADPCTDKMLEISRREWEFFGKQTIRDGHIVNPGHRETEEGYWQKVGVFWKEGVNLPLTGKDTDEPWSAAFISYVMRKAGAGERFLYSEWHAHYIQRAMKAREEQDPNYGFWGYRLSERAPQLGDLVCYAREDGVDFDHLPPVFKSHCDLVVAVRPREIDVIGGNVEDSVTLKTLATDDKGMLIDKNNKWIAVLRNLFVDDKVEE